MRNVALGILSAFALGVGLVGTAVMARAADLGYDGYDGYDEPTTVITRRTTIERQIVRAPPVVHEVVVERPFIYQPRPVVREVVVERPVEYYRPRPLYRQEFVERDGFYGPRPFRRGPSGFRYDRPYFHAYD